MSASGRYRPRFRTEQVECQHPVATARGSATGPSLTVGLPPRFVNWYRPSLTVGLLTLRVNIARRPASAFIKAR
jgi:hypothetical protein